MLVKSRWVSQDPQELRPSTVKRKLTRSVTDCIPSRRTAREATAAVIARSAPMEVQMQTTHHQCSKPRYIVDGVSDPPPLSRNHVDQDGARFSLGGKRHCTTGGQHLRYLAGSRDFP